MPIVILFLQFVHSWFKSQRNLAIENMALKQQVNYAPQIGQASSCLGGRQTVLDTDIKI